MAEERMRVLDMVREGKITADEAARLLEALKTDGGGGGGGAKPSGERAPAQGWGDDPVASITSAVSELLQRSGLGNLGNWSGRGGWSSGPLNGAERRRQRQADGWEEVPLSDGDHGTFDLPEGASFRVETESGAIDATVAEGNRVSLTLEGENLAGYAVYAARKGDEVVLCSYRTEHIARMPRLVVAVPQSVSRLALKTSGGGLRATGFACPVNLHTSGGGIKVREQGAGVLEAHTSGGGIDVEGRPAGVDLHTSGGGISFKGQTESLQAKTSGGSISLDGVRLTEGEHRAKTAGGSVRVRLTADSSVDVSAQTSAGHLSVDLPGIQGEQSGPRMSPRYRGKYNGGAAKLDLGTAAGSVSVGLVEG
jgi:hypothetical protein